MTAFDHFSVMVQQLAQHWGVAADSPVHECMSHFASENDGDIMLRLSDDESVVMVGASLPLFRLCDTPIERDALQIFLLQRAHTARLASRVRYAWLQESDRIALYCDIEMSDATAEKILNALDNLNARFDALAQAIPVFHQTGATAHTPDSMNFLARV